MSVVAEQGGELYALLVDQVSEVLSLDASMFERNPPTLEKCWADFSTGIFRLDGRLLVACGLLFFQDPLLNYFNTWSTYNSWMFNRGSWKPVARSNSRFTVPTAARMACCWKTAPSFAWSRAIRRRTRIAW